MTDEEQQLPEETAVDDIVAAARRRYGSVGAGLAAGMMGLEIALGTKKKPDSVQIQEAPTDPIDIDADGIAVQIDESTTVASAPLERRAPITPSRRRGRR